MSSPLQLIKQGIVKGDLSLVAKGYKKITGETIKPSTTKYEKIFYQLRHMIQTLEQEEEVETEVPQYTIEGENNEEVKITKDNVINESDIEVGIYDEKTNSIKPPKKPKRRKLKKKQLQVIDANE